MRMLSSSAPPWEIYMFIELDNANEHHLAGLLLLFLGATGLPEQMLAALPNVTPWVMQN